MRWIVGYILKNSRFKIGCLAWLKNGIFFGRFVQAGLLAWPRLALRGITKSNTAYVLRQCTANITISIAYPSTVLSGGS